MLIKNNWYKNYTETRYCATRFRGVLSNYTEQSDFETILNNFQTSISITICYFILLFSFIELTEQLWSSVAAL